jgi:hypothetical protein
MVVAETSPSVPRKDGEGAYRTSRRARPDRLERAQARGLGAKVNQTVGNRTSSAGSRWNRSGPVHEPVRFPLTNCAYIFLTTSNRPVSPVYRPVFFEPRKPTGGGLVNLARGTATPPGVHRTQTMPDTCLWHRRRRLEYCRCRLKLTPHTPADPV